MASRVRQVKSGAKLSVRVIKYLWFITFGLRRPKQDLRRDPHEYLDLLRPEATVGLKFVQFLLFPAVFIWILRVQSYVTPAHANTLQSWVLGHLLIISWVPFVLSGFPWTVSLVLLPLVVLFYSRGVFRARLIFANEPYTDNRRFYVRQLWVGARNRGPELVMFVSLAVAIGLDLAQHVGNPLDHPILNTVAFVALTVSLCSALRAGWKLASWYIDDVQERYRLLQEFKLEAVTKLPDDLHGMPLLQAKLARTFQARDLDALQRYAEEIGYTVTDYDLVLLGRTAQLTPVIAGEQQWLESATRNSGRPAYEFGVEFEWAENEENARDMRPERLDSARINRSPVSGLSPEKRAAFYQSMIDGTPDWGNGCTIEDTNDNPVVVLRWGKPIALPVMVPMRELLPETYSPHEWPNIFIGKDPEGTKQGINLKFGPHALVVGPTGAGKTIVLRMIAVRALACGHDVIVIDPMKAGVDFASIEPWLTMRVTNIIDAAKTMKKIYREVERRKAVLVEHGRGFWADLPQEVRDRENIRPLTVIIDEFTSLVLPEEVSKRMAKIDPDEFERAEETNDAKETFKIYAGKNGREARFVAIHEAIAAQRPDAAIFGGEFRSNLTSGVLAIKPNQSPTPQTLGMVFPGTSLDAAEVVRTLDDGNQGLALVGAEGGTVQGIKIGYELEDNIAAILDELKVPKPQKWTLDDDSASVSTAIDTTATTQAQAGPSTSVAVLERPAAKSSILLDLYPREEHK